MTYRSAATGPLETYRRNVRRGLALVLSDRTTTTYLAIICGAFVLALVGPWIAPYEYNQTVYVDGRIHRLATPSLAHPLGTTWEGYDVLSRLLYGARPSVLTGVLGGGLIISVGLLVGVTAGWYGGNVDAALMRMTDVFYGVPLIPFAIVLVALLNIGFYTSIAVIGLLLWRNSARVLRAQVLQLKARPYVKAARATGAGNTRIVVRHVLPNIAPMAIMFFALGVGHSILIEASLSFLGIADPFVPSWGVMVRNAYNSGTMSRAWWWALPPGILIATLVVSFCMLGRKYGSMAGNEGNGTTY
ncbi:ABC transporter permease [Natronobiforma cellulositropha]|uniref:ABC transporter permease n=1 Tax=Natronobiforma cellulositropha TaxID=1679076 RepID=UPI0021D594ED|nr:ABC transporter permease [Natronobiforma cellulositropha]